MGGEGTVTRRMLIEESHMLPSRGLQGWQRGLGRGGGLNQRGAGWGGGGDEGSNGTNKNTKLLVKIPPEVWESMMLLLTLEIEIEDRW
jgi:hypothetical protein